MAVGASFCVSGADATGATRKSLARETPTCEPTEITLGGALSWDVSYADFPSDESWQLRYYLRGPDDFDLTFGTHVTAASSGAGFEVRVTAAQVAAACTKPGAYRLIGRVNKSGDEFDGTIVYNRHLLVLADPSEAVNAKSHNRRVLEALQAATAENIGGRTLYKSQSVNGRSAEFLTPEEHSRPLAEYTLLVALEDNPDGVVQHAGTFVNA